MKTKLIFSFILVIFSMHITYAQIDYPGHEPGKAIVLTLQGKQMIMSNDVFKFELANNDKNIFIKSFEDKIADIKFHLNDAPLFELTLADDNVINSNDFILLKPPVISNIDIKPNSLTVAKKIPGKKYSAILENKKLGLSVKWEAHLRDGSNYIRQIFAFSSTEEVAVKKITLIKIPLDIGVTGAGKFNGIPITYKNMFFAIENPLSILEVIEPDCDCEDQTTYLLSTIPLYKPITQSGSYSISSVWGITPVGQLRRGFLYYMERERAAPYHQVSFYNSFGDLAWFDRKMSERACLERIRWIGDSLVVKRHVQLTGFLFDDGWDDPKTLWQFHPSFPNGFTKMKEVAESYGSSLGVWISPYGGFREPKRQRIEYGKMQDPPFETNEYGFSLSGPVYYSRYKEVLINFIKENGIIMLKFDGIAGKYKEDMEAYLRIIQEVRETKPDMYFFLTTGTYPSPFFIKYGDVVWRGGEDWSAAGEGSKRQQWITYRDAEVYKNVVKGSPLYPLNALQQMGIFICDISDEKYQNFPGGLGMDPKDVSDDIWAALGTGTSVQGLYINAYRMNTHAWDCLADALKWAKSNENVMVDTHWIGGDPVKGEIYGFAAWSPEKAVLTLRNPSSEIKTFEINTSIVFELPNGKVTDFRFYDAKKNLIRDQDQPKMQGSSFKITLQPFEVMVFDAYPNEK